MNHAVAVITGVSSGIGNATARALVARGYRVFGTARSETSIVPEKVERVLLDVRDGESIQRGVDEVLAKAGHIDLLVNNAGGSLDGAFEETPLGQARDLFELNFFGAVRMTQAVLPAMRARKSGRIVFVSSVLGFSPAPFMGFYAASKHALEGLAESLDHETRTLGIRVALVEPGYTRTNFDANGSSAPALVADYAAALDRTRAKMRAALSAGDEPEMVAEAGLEAATSKKPRLRYPAGSRAGRLRRPRRGLPAERLARGPANSAEQMVRRYLSKPHRDAPGSGCPLPALASDMARQPRAVRRAYSDGVRNALARLEQLAPDTPSVTRHALLAGLVGALAIARAVDDDELSSAILHDSREFWIRVLTRARRDGGPGREGIERQARPRDRT